MVTRTLARAARAAVAAALALSALALAPAPALAAAPAVAYRTHIQNVGWQAWKRDGATSGTSGRGLRLEAINVKLEGAPGGIQYRTHIQNVGWQAWKSNGALSGTSGRGLRLEAIQVRLTGDVARTHDVWYRVHAQNVGWMGWARNGAMAGTAAHAWRLEAIQIRLVAKGRTAPGPSSRAYLDGAGYVSGVPDAESGVLYRTHVQSDGWQNYMRDGEVAGTTGRSLRLEGINVRLGGALSGGIRYRTHIQSVGWEGGWKSNGAMSGTSGRALRLEAIQIELTGAAAKTHDVWYRVHAQNFGWLGWARDGESSGTAGYAYRLEGIEVRVLPKGATPPGSTKAVFWQGGRATDGAGRTRATYAVCFSANGGTGSMAAQTVERGVKTALRACAFSRPGYAFDGWNAKADGSGAAYADGAAVTDLAATGATVTLYAQWRPVATYAIRFDANGGTGSMAAQVVEDGERVALRACAFTREGHSFSGWNTRADGTGTHYAEGQAVQGLAPAGGAVTLYAQWAPEAAGETYMVGYFPNGVGDPVVQDIAVGRATALHRCDFSGTSYADRQVVTDLAPAGERIALYAQWRVDWAAVAVAYGAVLDAAAALDYGRGVAPAAPYGYALADLDGGEIPALLVRCSDGNGLSYVVAYRCSSVATAAQRAEGSAIVTGVAGAGGFRGSLGKAADGPGLVHVAYQSGTGQWQATRLTLSGATLASEDLGVGRIDDGRVPASSPLEWRDVSDRSLLRALADNTGDNTGDDAEDDLRLVTLIVSEPYDAVVTVPAVTHAEERTVTKYRTENRYVGDDTEYTCAICGETHRTGEIDSHEHLYAHGAHAGNFLNENPEALALFAADPDHFAETYPYIWAELNVGHDGSDLSDQHNVPIYEDVEVPYEEVEWVEVVDEPERTYVEHRPAGYRDAWVNSKGEFVRWVEPDAE